MKDMIWRGSLISLGASAIGGVANYMATGDIAKAAVVVLIGFVIGVTILAIFSFANRER